MNQKIVSIILALSLTFISNAQIPAQLLPQSGTLNNLYLVSKKDSIYRSKQPQAEDYRMLIEKFHIKTVLKLNAEDSEDLDTTKFMLKVVPIRYDQKPGKELSLALKILHAAPKPILVHCHAGVDRTGLVIALYRIIFEKYSRAEAGAEMKNIPGWNGLPALKEFFDKFDIDSMRVEVLTDLIPYDDAQIGSQSEISGALINNNGCFLIKEDMGDLIQLDDGFRYKNTIHLAEKGLSGDYELEGISIYKHHMLMSNEAKGNVCVYDYNLNKDKVFRIQPDNLQNDYGNRGIEGIAVNGKICYIMKERNDNYQSILKMYRISETPNDQLKLLFIDSLIFDHRTKEGIPEPWRYSDIYFDPTLRKLFCLKSLYTTNRKEYRVDLVEITDKKLTARKKINTYEFEFINLSYKVQNLKLEDPLINTNLEAITIRNKRLYLLSDNYYVPADINSKTLFLVSDILK